MSAPSPVKEKVRIRDKVCPKSLSVVSMMKLGKVIKDSKNSFVEVSTFDMQSIYICDSELEGPYGGPVPKKLKTKAVSPQSESRKEYYVCSKPCKRESPH